MAYLRFGDKMQRRMAVRSSANACEKEKRAREEQEREEKTRVLKYSRWVFLKKISSRSKIFAKYLLCEIAFFV
jgi:hypothetical protein